MPELNTNTPIIYTLLRQEYLYNLKRNVGSYTPCAIFGAASVQGRAIGFHAMLNVGALIYRLPISAFTSTQHAEHLPLDYLQLWDCLSPRVTCVEYKFLRGMAVAVLMKDKETRTGVYLFTLDWHGNSLSDNPGEGGHKCAHVIHLDCGCYCAQPNNRIRWYEPSFITAPFPSPPDYETNNIVWSVENKGGRWATEDSDRMFYSISTEKDLDGK